MLCNTSIYKYFNLCVIQMKLILQYNNINCLTFTIRT